MMRTFFARHGVDVGGKTLAAVLRLQERRELLLQRIAVFKRKVFRSRLDKEIERVVRGQIRDQVDIDDQLAGFLRKHQPRHVIGKRILNPIDEVIGRFDIEAVADNRCTTVRRRPQPHHLRAERDAPVVLIGHGVA